MRLFILGIGDTVSSDVCEQLSRAGHGQYLLAVSQESILLKCTSLLRASRISTIKDVSVDWAAGTSPLQQSPPELSIPELYPSTRSVYFAIVHTDTIPEQVVIRGKVDGKDVFISVEVESVKFGRRPSEPPFIHTLAANRLIRDLEDGNAKGKQSQVTQREEIVRLGEYYQLASSHTSFVAVDYGVVHLHPPIQQMPSTLSTVVTSFAGTIWQYLTDPTALFRSPMTTVTSRQGRNNGLPGGWSPSESVNSEVPSETDSDTDYSGENEDDDDWASDNTFSTLSSLESYSSAGGRQARRPQRSGSTRQQGRALSPQAPYSPPTAASPAAGRRPERFKPLPINPHVATLVQQMSTLGSFSLTGALGLIVGTEAMEEARS